MPSLCCQAGNNNITLESIAANALGKLIVNYRDKNQISNFIETPDNILEYCNDFYIWIQNNDYLKNCLKYRIHSFSIIYTHYHTPRLSADGLEEAGIKYSFKLNRSGGVEIVIHLYD